MNIEHIVLLDRKRTGDELRRYINSLRNCLHNIKNTKQNETIIKDALLHLEQIDRICLNLQRSG